MQLRFINVRWGNARKTVHLFAAELSRVFDCLADGISEFTDTGRQTADAAFAFLGIARRDIDEHHLDPGVLCDLREPALLPGVGKLDLDRLEAGLSRRLEALGKLQLLEQHADVGAEAGHRWRVGASTPGWLTRMVRIWATSSRMAWAQTVGYAPTTPLPPRSELAP